MGNKTIQSVLYLFITIIFFQCEKDSINSNNNLKSYNFKVDVVSGSRLGESYTGKFSYIQSRQTLHNFTTDPIACGSVYDQTNETLDTLLVELFEFKYSGKSYGINDLDFLPYVVTINGNFKDIYFVGGSIDSRFGLNTGFCRFQFSRESEQFIRDGSGYFGYLDAFTSVDGAGSIEYILQ